MISTMPNSRNKGASFEREVANYLKLHLSLQDVKRDIEQYRQADRGDLLGVDGWTIECKRYKRPQSSVGIYRSEWWEQVVKASEKAKNKPLLIFKFDHQPIRCALYLKDINKKYKGNDVAIVTLESWVKIFWSIR
jgi:Holliday junction resolvase